MCLTTPRAECELQVSHEAPRRARRFLKAAACPEHHSALVDDAMVLASELVTNSVLHGGPPLIVAVECDGTFLQVRVRDGSPALPTPRAAAQGDENGRGLALVAAMSDDWGVEPDADGKLVWFVLHGGTPTRSPD
jgi:anti-sigma regulatory factor (Ser/Thr protein kinase)